MKRARSAAYWITPSLLCLLLHWRGFTSWFSGDDFAWLGLNLDIYNFHDFLSALFRPEAQGTLRPWSERAFFMAGFGLFGLNPLPFRALVFATQFANLGLVAWIGDRISGRRGPGFWAAVFWAVNGALLYPLGWACVYNQVMCGFFLLLAFCFLLRYVETGARRYNSWQWAVFLLGFGALEINLVYPAIAAGYTYLCARKYFRRTLPLFVPSVVYLAIHTAVAPVQRTGEYAMHFTGAMLRTLGTYWTWSAGPTYLWSPFDLPKWLLPAGVATVSAALLAFLILKVRGGEKAVLVAPLWYLATLAPVLPIRDHVTEYYVYLPLIGVCWLGGWAFVEGWRRAGNARVAAVAVAAVYACMAVPQTIEASDWYYRLTLRVRNLVEGVARAHELHPRQAILLTGMDNEMFWDGLRNRPFRLIGVNQVYLAPGSESRITAYPGRGEISEFILPAHTVARALDRDELAVYDVSGPRLRNITSAYASMPRDTRLPTRIDAASPLTSYLLGPEWYGSDGDHRWMPARATLRMGAPAAAGAQLHLSGNCPDEQLRAGPLSVNVTVNGARLPAAAIRPGENAFDLAFPLPASAAGAPELEIAIQVNRTMRPANDPRDLGLAFGVFELR
jgi:hypothetical protein